MIIATGTASGKTLAYLVPAITEVLDGATVLYLTPTKALAADQLRALRAFDMPPLRAACFDGDTPFEERAWIRQHANYVLTNPDMVHRNLLPRHAQWSTFLRRLRMVIVDECHGYRGVFGSHVAQILRRLRRVTAKYGSRPVFMLASATARDPGIAATRLTGLETVEVTTDTSPRGATTFALWEPPLTDLRGEGGAPVRRTAAAETADLLADLVAANVRTLAFVRSRRGAETVAMTARAKLSDLLPPSRSSTLSEQPLSAPRPLQNQTTTPYTQGTRNTTSPSRRHPLSPSEEPSAPAHEAAPHGQEPAPGNRENKPAAPESRPGDHNGGPATPESRPGDRNTGPAIPEIGLDDRDSGPTAPESHQHNRNSRSATPVKEPSDGGPAVPEIGPGDRENDSLAGSSPSGEFTLDDDLRDLPNKVAAYRAGYLAEDRRLLEKAVRTGTLIGLATTNALELGVDISGLDAVLIAGWPGTRASLWQQAGRAGRAGQDALAVLIARDDPLDTYLVHHPEALFGQPVESIVLDPDNSYVLAPHLCAAAAEIPLTDNDLSIFGPSSPAVLDDLVARGLLRRRASGWFWTSRERATDLADIRGGGGQLIQLVEQTTGRLLGTVDESSAHTSVHTGAVYVHQGESFLVKELDLETGIALLTSGEPDYSTYARDVTDITVLSTLRSHPLGHGHLHFGEVEVTRQVISYLKRRLQTGEMLGDEPLDLPPRTLRTRAVWWTLPPSRVSELAETGLHLGGAAHAAEHASIGLLPLFATCDRWDIGGVSTELHPDTGLLTVFVYDGHQGGAGFAERGYARAADWLRATREAIASCECERGCPSCIQSPKCGNGNDPLDKAGALQLLDILLP
ncbi:DEAD/DEAH box helicase [Sinosporangium album]|uniref:DEAD/DEAH box helicase n=1 Tax=Sinosporangium album TaxID=504805 RepID=UPI001FDF2692